MARQDYIVSVQAQTAQAEKNVQRLGTRLFGLAAAVGKGGVSAGRFSTVFAGLGTTLLGTAATFAFIGGAVETAMFRSRVAIEAVGGSAKALAEKFHAAGRSATELLPVAAQFARFGIASDELDGVSEVARKMGRVLGMSAKEAGAALSEIGGRAGLRTTEEFKKLASGITAAERAFDGITDSNFRMLKALAPTAAEVGVNAGALIGFNVAAHKAGVGAEAAEKSLSVMLESFRFGPDIAAGMAQSLGMTADKVDKFLAADPTDQLQMMVLAMRNLSGDAKKNAVVLETLFGITRAEATAMLRMAKDTDAVSGAMVQFRREVRNGTALTKSAEEEALTLAGRMHDLWDEIKRVSEDTGITPFLREVVSGLKSVVHWFGELSPGVRTAIVSFVGLVGAMFTISRAVSAVRFIGAPFAHTLVAISKGAAGAAAAASRWGIIGRIFGVVRGAAMALVPGLVSLAGAAWAAVAPWLPFIAIAALVAAAVAAIGYVVYRVVKGIVAHWGDITAAIAQWWTEFKGGLGVIGDFFVSLYDGIVAGGAAFVGWVASAADAVWGFATSIYSGAVAGLNALWGVVVSVSGAVWGLATSIYEGVISGVKSLWSLVVSAGDAILSPFRKLGELLGPIASGIGSVVGALFGSSMFHLKEGVAEVIPSLRRMEGAFAAVGRASQRVGLGSAIPDDMRVRVEEPIGRVGAGRFSGLSEKAEGTQAFGGPAGSGPGRHERVTTAAAGAAAGGGPTIRVVVPTTVVLDGEKIARAVAEYEVTVGRERHMNAPAEPLRGTGR